MNEPVVTPDAIGRAARRLEDFMMVTAGRPKADFAEAVALFAQAAGLDRDAHEALRRRIERSTQDEDHVSWCVIGTILGLWLADERRRT